MIKRGALLFEQGELMNAISRKIALFAFALRKLASRGKMKGHLKNYFLGCSVSITGAGECTLGKGNVFEKGCFLEVAEGKLTLGNDNYFNRNARIACLGAITIGNGCLFG